MNYEDIFRLINMTCSTSIVGAFALYIRETTPLLNDAIIRTNEVFSRNAVEIANRTDQTLLNLREMQNLVKYNLDKLECYPANVCCEVAENIADIGIARTSTLLALIFNPLVRLTVINGGSVIITSVSSLTLNDRQKRVIEEFKENMDYVFKQLNDNCDNLPVRSIRTGKNRRIEYLDSSC